MTIQKVIESLNAYTGDEQALNDFVAVATSEIGPDWTERIYTELAEIPASLKEKLDHAFNYYAATTAWNEIQSYINQSEPLNYKQTVERVPVLEHWLAFFGAAGEEAVARLQARLKQEGETQSQDTSVLDEPFSSVNNVVPVVQQPVEQSIEEEETITDEPEIETTDVVLDEPTQEAASQNFKPNFIEDEETNVAPLSQTALQERINDIFSDADEMEGEPEDTSVSEVMDEEPNLPQAEPVVIGEIQNPEPISEPISESIPEPVAALQQPVKTLASVVAQDVILLAETVAKTTPLTAESEPEWRISKIFKQLDFVISIQAWVSKRCHDLGYTDYYTYRYYGFLVDVLDTTIAELKATLGDTALYDLIEKRQPNGVRYLQNQLLAFEKESKEAHDGVLADLSPLPREGLSVDDLKRNLGGMDTSDSKEYLGPAPDGFEVVDDPYAGLSDETLKKEYAKLEETGTLSDMSVAEERPVQKPVERSATKPVVQAVKNQVSSVNNTSQTPQNGVQRKMSFNFGPKKPTDSGATGA